jgi:hypothetical protein
MNPMEVVVPVAMVLGSLFLTIVCFRLKSMWGIIGGILLLLLTVFLALFAALYIGIQARGGLQIPF